MGPPRSINGPVAPSRAQKPLPDSRLNHIPDPAVHANCREFVHDLRRPPDLLTFCLSLRLQALLKDPRNQHPSALVNIKREDGVVLALALHSDSHPISNWGWEGILLPQTRSVESIPVQQISSMKLLKLSIQVLACARGDANAQPCNNCWSRERRSLVHNVQPYSRSSLSV